MSNIPKSMKDAEIVLSDSDRSNTLTLTLEEGDFSYTVPDTHQHVPDRGAPGNLIDGEFEAVTFSMTVQVKELTGSAGIADVVQGTASGWDFSVMDDSGFTGVTYTAGTDTIAASSVNVFQMQVTYTDPGDGGTEQLTFPNCTASFSFNEGMPNKISLSGTSYVTGSALQTNIVTG